MPDPSMIRDARDGWHQKLGTHVYCEIAGERVGQKNPWNPIGLYAVLRGRLYPYRPPSVAIFIRTFDHNLKFSKNLIYYYFLSRICAGSFPLSNSKKAAPKEFPKTLLNLGTLLESAESLSKKINVNYKKWLYTFSSCSIFIRFFLKRSAFSPRPCYPSNNLDIRQAIPARAS